MKLSAYISKKKMTNAEFGTLVGLSQSQVSRIRRGVSRPSWEAMGRIEKETGGKVTFKDFAADEVAA